MPYIIEMIRRTYLPTDPGASPMWRDECGSSHAVATLEDARDAAFECMAEVPSYALSDAARISDSIHALPEAGGVIGPLPDGYVINVQYDDWPELWARAGRPEHQTHQEIIDAYNAQ